MPFCFEQRRVPDLSRNRRNYQALLDRIKMSLDGTPSSANSIAH